MALLFAALIALIHVYTFYMESLAWGTPRINKMFRVNERDAAIMKGMAFNQGFYNLFLAIAIIAGMVLRASGKDVQGNMLIDYAALSVLGAGAVLFGWDRKLARPALIQALPALGYLGFRFLGY